MHRKEMAAGIGMILLAALLTVCLVLPATAQVLLVDDPLQGSTTGEFHGGSGQFVSGGWKVTGQYDGLFWRLPYSPTSGAIEFYVKGLNPGECRPGMADRSEILCMYDWTFGAADYNYSGGYRDCYHKMFVAKNGCGYIPYGLGDTAKTLWQIWPDYSEDYSHLSWDSNTNYLFRVEWEPDGSGNSTCRFYRDGGLFKTYTIVGTWNPAGTSVRIAASSRRDPDNGAPVDAIFSYVKVWDRSAQVAPAAPKAIWPVSGGVSKSLTPRIHWTGDTHTNYQVRVNTANNPDSGIVWDSGNVASNLEQAVSGNLSNGQTYYVFVRLANAYGWSNWSSTGHSFTTNTAHVWERRGPVFMSGSAVRDDNGEFLGLGTTYMSAMRFCRSDRNRFRQDLALIAAGGSNYIRMITMVGWYDAWRHLEIAPVSFYNMNNDYVEVWPDYWQQFRDTIDIAYDEYGLRSEVTIFADAQLMPNKNDRYNHMQGVLDNLATRVEKVMHFEVCNEAWQNGFPDWEGIADLREFGNWLKVRTGRPVALSAPWGGEPSDFSDLYAGCNADLSTGHFERWNTGPEGGWLPVRDCWKVVGIPGVPPCSNNEPIGPGSSVASENEPIRLVSAAVFSWIAKLPMYVYHTSAGVFGIDRFENMQALHDYKYLLGILPGDLANWYRNDGKETSAPFTVFCNGTPNAYWTDIGGATTGCHRNIGSRQGNDFVSYPQGILSGGLTLQARQQMTFTVYNPLTGAVVMGPVSKSTGEQVYLPQGPGAYIIVGTGVTGPYCASDEFTYPNGALNGNGGWYGSAPSSRIEVLDGYVKLWGGAGSADAIRWMNCGDGSDYIEVEIKVHPGTGGRTIWSFWIDDTSGKNLGRWYGTANTARGRIASTGDVTAEQTLVSGWNTLLAKIYPASNTTEFVFNGTSLGTLSHASQGAGDIVGRVRIESIDNGEAVGHNIFFDNLSTTASVSDTTPPGPVTNFIATPGDGQISLSWTNPGDADFAGTMIRFSTAGFPGSPTGGTQVYNGTGTSTVHSNLTNGVTYYYSAFAYDGVPNYSAVATASATPVAPLVNNAQLVSDTIPTTMVAGQQYNVSVTMKNTGTTTWSYANEYKLGAVDNSDPFAGARHFLNPGETVAPNAQRTFNFTMTAPATPGQYTTDWRMLRELVEWFGDTCIKQVQVNAPAPTFCFQDEFIYGDGALVGQGGWTGNATSSHIQVTGQMVKVIGGSGARNATKAINCTASPSGLIWVRLLAYKGIGDATMWDVWINDTTGKNLARWYGTGTTARGRIGSSGLVTSVQNLQGNGVWDSLVVKIDVVANTTQFFYNGGDLGTFSHSSTGAGDVAGQVVIERSNNNGASGHHMFLDNIRVSEN